MTSFIFLLFLLSNFIAFVVFKTLVTIFLSIS